MIAYLSDYKGLIRHGVGRGQYIFPASPELAGELELFLGREGFVEVLAGGLIDEISGGGRILAGDAVQIAGDELLAEEE